MSVVNKPKKAPSKYPDWAGLSKDFLEQILQKLVLSDCVRFSSVCKPWRSAVLENLRLIRTCKRFPLLLIPTSTNQNHTLYCPIHKKLVGSVVMYPYDRRLVGSSHGWLAMVDKDSAITLINPFIGGSIPLPPIFHVTNNPNEYFIKKVILSSDPYLNPNDYKVVALHDIPYRSMAIIRPGDKGWTHVVIDSDGMHVADVNEQLEKLESLYILSDVIYHKGKIYAVDTKCRLILFDYDSDSNLQDKIIVSNVTERRHYTYLVESSGGDLLLIQRIVYRRKSNSRGVLTSKLNVFKLNYSVCPDWVETNSLGGDALFLGVNDSMSIMAALVPECQSNSIYYTHDYTDFATRIDFSGHDMGLFNLEDGSRGKYYIPDPPESLPPMPPVWILPTMRGI